MNPNTNTNTNKSSSLALDLESLNSTYKNLLTKYKQAVLDYIDNLNVQAAIPCGKYTAGSTGIDQKCYDEIWKKAGCKITNIVTSDKVTQKTLNELIYDSFLWATMTDDEPRKRCYGTTEGSPYYIIGVGADGKLYMRKSLESNWIMVTDDAANDLTSVCTGNDGKMIIASTKGNNVYYKDTYEALKWKSTENNCCVISVAMGQDGSLVGVGMDNKLYTKSNLNASWTQTASSGEYIKSICIAPDGSIFCIGNNYAIFKKNSYKNLPTQSWQYMGNNTCCKKAITIASDGTFIGVGTDNQLYIKYSYKNLSTSWKGPYKNSCCVIGITTIANPNYNGAIFSTATKPNYNINSPILTEIKGQAFWGTSSVSENVSNTLQHCSASCSNTPNCTGATFNSDQKYCWLRGGEGSAIPSKVNDYAIVPKSRQLLKIVESLNNEIIVVNRKMQKKIDELYGVYSTQVGNRLNQNYSLINQYDSLNADRDKINSIISEYQTLEGTQNEMEIYITKNYYLFFIFFIIVLIAGIILAMSSLDQNTSNAVAFSIINHVVAPAKTVVNNVNPFYVMFGIILLVVISYLYNQYITSIYNNTPSFKNMGQLGIVYFVFAIAIIFVVITYFMKNSNFYFI